MARRSNPSRSAKSASATRLVLPDGRFCVAGTWLWREPTGRFARVELAEVIYSVRWAA